MHDGECTPEPPHKRCKQDKRKIGAHETNLFNPIKHFAQTWNCPVLAKNQSLLTLLTNSAKLVYRSNLSGKSFWLSHQECCSNKILLPIENLARSIYRSFVARHGASDGCEWWVQVRPDDDKATNQQDREAVRFHFDKDEDELQSHKRFVGVRVVLLVFLIKPTLLSNSGGNMSTPHIDRGERDHRRESWMHILQPYKLFMT